MKFLRSTQSGFTHTLRHWAGSVIWTTCGEIVDMQRDSVALFDQEKAPDNFCSDCAVEEARNAYIPGASR